MKQFIYKQAASIISVFILAIALCGLRPSLLNADQYKPGFCPITEKRIISRSGQILSNYMIIWFELSNGARMPVAVDRTAVITEADFERIMQHVKDGWQWEISRKKWSPEQIQNYKDTYFNLTIKKIIE